MHTMGLYGHRHVTSTHRAHIEFKFEQPGSQIWANVTVPIYGRQMWGYATLPTVALRHNTPLPSGDKHAPKHTATERLARNNFPGSIKWPTL